LLDARARSAAVIPLALLVGTFDWSFVYVSLPFYILRLSIQGLMTVGQVMGPLAGAIAAARVGFRASFVVGAAILLSSAALVRWGAQSPPAIEPGPTLCSPGRPPARSTSCWR
jgi:hypothetical protein